MQNAIPLSFLLGGSVSVSRRAATGFLNQLIRSGVLILLALAAFALPASAQTAHFAGAQSVVANHTNNGLNNPSGVAVDGVGNLYIADLGNDQVLKETLSAGSYTQSVVANGTSNGLSTPEGVAVDSSGNVYIADAGNNRVLKETLSAGSYTQNVVANAASNGLDWPTGVAVDGSGNVYIVDYYNNRVLKETLSAGSYTQSVVANAANNDLQEPDGVAVDESGNVYVSDWSASRVLKETLSAGSYTQSVVANAANNGLSYPWGIAVDGSGNVYIADTNNNRVLDEASSSGNFGTVDVGSKGTTPISMIFTFDTAGTLTSYAVLTQGVAGLDFADAGTGTCTTGNPYIAGETCIVDVSFAPAAPGARYGAAELMDGSGKVLATGYVQGTGVGPQVNFLPGTQSVVANAATNGLHEPSDVAVDGSGNVYIADWSNKRVLKETLSAGSYTQSVIANAANDGLAGPEAVAVDGSGNVYIADDSYRVLKETLSAAGYTQSVVANYANNGLSFAVGVAVDGSGNVYIADFVDSRVLKEALSAGGYTQSVVANNANNGLLEPWGVAVDGSGNVYIADYENRRVLKETLSAGGYTQSVVADATSDGLDWPFGVAVDGSGNVYFADSGNNRVLKETLSAGSYTQSVVANVANNGLDFPEGVAVDNSGNVYIADNTNNQVLKEDFADAPSLTFASTAEGSTSSDSPQTVTVENIGNAPLAFPVPSAGTNPSISANFTINSSVASACPLVTSTSLTAGTLAAGTSCLLPISFTPTTTGVLNGSLVLTDTALNATAPVYAVQTIQLSGTGTGGQTTPTITWPTPAAIAYGTPLSATQLDAAATSSGATVAGTFTYAPEAGTVLGAGTQTLSVTFTPANTSKYSPATATVQLVVNKAVLTVAPEPPPAGAAEFALGYGDRFPYATDLCQISGFVNGDTLSAVSGSPSPTVSWGSNPEPPVGNYSLTCALGTLSADNYTFSLNGAPEIIAVTPDPLNIKPVSLTRKYGTGLPAFIYNATGLAYGQTLASVLIGTPTISSTATGTSGVGNYPITLNLAGVSAGPNYTLTTPPTATLTITPALLNARAINAAAKYGNPPPSLGYRLSGFVNGDTSSVVSGAATLTTTATAGSPVGSYPIAFAGEGLSAQNYTIDYLGATLAVTPAILVARAINVVVVAGQPIPPLTYRITGFVNGDTSSVVTGTATLTTTATAGSPVGTYPITFATENLGAANYKVGYVGATLTIQAKK